MNKIRVFESFLEEWKDIKGYEGIYQVSNLGRIKSLPRKISNGTGFYVSKEKILKGHANAKGYIQVELRRNLKRRLILIHRIVAEHFIDNVYNKPQVNHIDGNKKNNKVYNLEWCTNGENQIHAYKNVLNKRSESAGRPKRKVCQIDLKTGEIIKIFNSIADVKTYFNKNKVNISEVCNGRRKSCLGFGWKYFEERTGVNEQK